MKNKIILIENREQAEYYINNADKFRNFFPTALVFEAEELLSRKGVIFKTDEDYEADRIFDNVYNSCLKKTEIIIDKVKFYYKKINLAHLLYADIFRFLAYFERNRIVIEEILRVESPEEIAVFESDKIGGAFDILKFLSEDKIRVIKLEKDEKNEKNINYLAGAVQKIAAKNIVNFSNKKKIFFSGSRTLFEPLVSELIKNKNNLLVRSHMNLQKSWFSGKKYIPFYQLSGFSGKRTNKDIEDIERNFAVNFSDLENKIIKNIIWKMLNEKFNLAMNIIDELECLAMKRKIDLFILDDGADFFQKLVINVCNIYGIPSIILQHGLISGEAKSIGDYVLAFGEKSKEKYIKFGFNPDEIIIVGAPQYDSFCFRDKNTNRNKKILYVVDAVNNEELIAGHHLTKKCQKEILKSLFRVMKKDFPDYGLVIKGRKNWDLNGLIDYVAKEEKFTNYSFFIDADKDELLSSADAVIIHYTTMGIEAMLFGKPVISYEFRGMEKWNVFSRMKNVKFAYNEKELGEAIKRSINEKQDGEKIRKILESELYKLDGKSTKRAVSFINGILSK
ncbi:hypothetical protein AUJ84_02045 [Candidatus Pacearchaeota archaeon CG1_02_32_132]|nr:MAG: hypothetical protein AUJ84_02045 [Candidatus Pacearchaeota archaeon CG1_02_32_132]